MNRTIIVHCWDGYPEYCWYQSTKKDLENRGFFVTIPSFPDTANPNLSKWLPVLKEVAAEPDEQLFLIGHSVGCITILRYLELLKPEQKIGGIVLVAGFTDDLGMKELSNFFTTNIDFPYIKSKVSHVTAIHSDNDPYVSLKYGDIFKEKLDADLIVKHDFKHFSGEVDNEESCIELPDVAEAIEKMIE